MKKVIYLLILILVLGCGSSRTTSDGPSNVQAELNKKNRGAIPLIDQIRQKPGVVIKNGRPALLKNYNTFSTLTQEPLYVLNDVIIGNSFDSVNDLINNFMVKKIEIVGDTDASFYGTRGANGVIKITTFSGEDTPEEN